MFSQLYNINHSEKDDYKDISVCIASDDPIVFNTNLSNEISYLYYGMLKRGYSKDKSLKWIDKLRDSGMQVSFIESNINCRQYYNKLKCVLKELENY